MIAKDGRGVEGGSESRRVSESGKGKGKDIFPSLSIYIHI